MLLYVSNPTGPSLYQAHLGLSACSCFLLDWSLESIKLYLWLLYNLTNINLSNVQVQLNLNFEKTFVGPWDMAFFILEILAIFGKGLGKNQNSQVLYFLYTIKYTVYWLHKWIYSFGYQVFTFYTVKLNTDFENIRKTMMMTVK